MFVFDVLGLPWRVGFFNIRLSFVHSWLTSSVYGVKSHECTNKYSSFV